MNEILVITGVSGVGKSSIIRELVRKEKQLVHVRQYTTRLLRKGESDKIHVSKEEMSIMLDEMPCLSFQLYGNQYAIPFRDLTSVLSTGKMPIIDYPIDGVRDVRNIPGSQKTLCVYLGPDSYETLGSTTRGSGRNKKTERLKRALHWSMAIENGYPYNRWERLVGLFVTNKEGQLDAAVEEVHRFYKKAKSSS